MVVFNPEQQKKYKNQNAGSKKLNPPNHLKP
jgi:hypothetical protein